CVALWGLSLVCHTGLGPGALFSFSSPPGAGPVRVHLKVDTGMHRVGAPAADAVELAAAISGRPELVLEGIWTHCAVADEPSHPFTAGQARRFEAVLAELAAAGLRAPVVHAANSAATIDHPALRHDLVRCGITVYGLDPSPALHGRVELRPALSLKARVSLVKVVAAGEAVSYGLRGPFAADSVVATVPLGYADGVPRRLSEVAGEVLVGGRRRRLVGTITMDQFLLDCGPAGGDAGAPVQPGDEVVLIGKQGGQRIGAEEWARRLGTIAYEVVCNISSRVPRRYLEEEGLP
ncbi:MAG: alanine racemase, partial [Acidimicrobiales bacterium]